MSQQQWPQPSRTPGGMGSVKRARERMEAGLPPEFPPDSRQPRVYDPSRAAPAPMNRSRPQMPPALATPRNGQGPIGVAISRPTQVPQWPLAGTIEGPEPKDPRTNQQYQPPPGRTIPPQRPPRPSRVPSILDGSRVQDHTPSFQYQPQQYQPERGQARGWSSEDDYSGSPVITSPTTQSSRPSTTSSVGTIPDFPVPMPAPPMPQRRSINLGPPPSSRRGATSYYSQSSFVSPIPEESPRALPSHESYASSAAIPSTWGSNSPGYQYDDEYDDESDISPRDLRYDVIEEGRESRESNMDDNDGRGLIRSASLGKRAKPSMIMTKSSERSDLRPSPVPQQPAQSMHQPSKLERMGVIDGGIIGAAIGGGMTAARMNNGQRETVWPMSGEDSPSPLRGGTGFLESSSGESVPTLATALTTDEAVVARAIPEPTTDAKTLQSSPTEGQLKSPNPGFSRLSAIRRPPRLDIDAVRNAEARGSLTSLPDLIRRATKLAAMMDRGKRPASRLNDLNDFPTPSDEKDGDLNSAEKRRSGLSGMLAAFPAAGAGTPRDATPRPVSSWPSPYNESNEPFGPNDPKQREKKRRRCCGLPCWAFLLLILVLLIIIAAAVVVPLEFLVFHKSKSTPTSTTSISVQQCAADATTACQNGGSSTIVDGACACICTNGFTGSTCSVAGSSGCTTTSLLGSSVNNVTLGEAIPRLIASAQTNFSIPLTETTILARLNAANLSCSSENALVTFDGQSERVNSVNEVVTASATSAAATSAVQKKRDDYHPPTTSAATTSTTSWGASSTTSSAAAATSSASFVSTDETLDFARVAVLYILQQENLDNAVSAQSALQKVFTSDSISYQDALNVSLGSGNTINLVGFSVNVGNGSVGTKSNSISRRFQARRRVYLE